MNKWSFIIADKVTDGAVVPTPIDLGAQGNQAYLILFGTGIRNAPSGQVSVRINGVNAPDTYAGSQLAFQGWIR